MQKFKTFLTVIGAVTILVLAANSAVYAATGGKFILGQVNKANKISTLKRTTSGPALGLVTKTSSSAPLSTNGRGKVTNLNADMLDGRDSTALRTNAKSWTRSVSTPASSTTIDLPLGPGTYILGYDAYMVNGGADAGMAGCYFWRKRGTNYTYTGESRFLTQGPDSVGATGTGIMTVASGDEAVLYCYAAAAWTTDSSEPIHVYAIPTNVTTSGTLRTAPPNARAIH